MYIPGASSPPYRLRLPGPATVPERVRAALASPMLNRRGPEFAEILAETTAFLRKIAGTSNEILLFACSGTGMMEAGLANVLAPGDKVIRFGTMGYLDESDIVIDLLHLERTLVDLAHPVTPGAGMAAASERLRGPQPMP